MLLALINLAAEDVYQGEQHWWLALAFVGVYGAAAAAQWLALLRASDALEQAITAVKLRNADKLRRCDLRFIEQQGGIDAYAP